MPQAGPVVINDGATTPVAHTFTPIGYDNNRVLWFEQTSPTPVNGIASKKFGYKMQRGIVESASKSLTSKSNVSVTLYAPTQETVANNSAGIVPPPQEAYREVGRFNFELAERSTKQERKDTRVLLANLLMHAMFVSSIDDLQPTMP